MIEAKLNIIDTPEKFHKFKDWLSKFKPEFMVIDTETDGLANKTAKLYGIGICFSEKNAFYIPWRTKEGQDVWQHKDQQFITWYLLQVAKECKVIGHNIIFDVLVLKNNLGMDITEYVYSDTILICHTLNEEGPFGLKDVAVKELGEWANKAKEVLYENIKVNGGKTNKDEVEMYKADTQILADYCMWDVLLTLALFKLLDPKLKEQELDKLFYEDEVMPLYKLVTIPMKDNGFPIDIAYYENLKEEITLKIKSLEDEIIRDVQPLVADFCYELLDGEVPINTAGIFPKKLAELLGAPLPIAQKKDKKTGQITSSITIAAKAIEKQKAQTPQFNAFYDWILGKINIQELTKPTNIAEQILYGEKYIPLELFQKAQLETYFERKGGRYVFNLKSNDHLAYLLFTRMGKKPLEMTPGGKPRVNDDYFDTLKDEDPTIQKLIDFKKLNKLLSTYVEGILSRQYEGKIYTDMLQFGTTSGRYSSRNPNLQNQPRIKDDEAGLSPLVLKYTNAIRLGFVAPKGYKIVNADYASLEPVCFAHVSNEEKLRNVFKNGEDLYSRIAIDVYKLENTSAHKKAPNYLKNLQPELRQKAKVFCLAVVYGAEEKRIQDVMGCSYGEARSIINAYLGAYPELKKYMYSCNQEAKRNGYVRTQFGRVRHLAECKTLNSLYGDRLLDYKWANKGNPNNDDLTQFRRRYKNLLNNAKNFKIQGLAAHIVNRAMVAAAKAFKEHNINGYIGLQVHDEITCVVEEKDAELAKKLLKFAMECTTIISVPLQAEPIIADNWGEAK